MNIKKFDRLIKKKGEKKLIYKCRKNYMNEGEGIQRF